MKRKVMAIILILALMLPITAQATTPRAIQCYPELSYSGRNAVCSVIIATEKTTDRIDAYITLWYGTTEIESWTDSANGYLDFSGLTLVDYGRTYRLTVDYWVNGQQQESAKVVKTCTQS